MIRLLFVLLFPVLLLLPFSLSFAQNTPTQAVNEIIAKMKEAQSPVVVLDYVSWEKAFQRFPAQQKEQLQVKNAADLKQFFDNLLRNPSEVVSARVNEEISKAAPEQQAKLKANLEQVVAGIKSKEAEMKARVAGTTYEVGGEEIKGNVATVMLSQTYKGEKKTEKVVLEKEGDKWLLPSAELGGSSNGQGSSGPGQSGPGSAGRTF